jgi:hypothetical protein
MQEKAGPTNPALLFGTMTKSPIVSFVVNELKKLETTKVHKGNLVKQNLRARN